MSRQLIRYNTVKLNNGTEVWRCVFNVRVRDVFIKYPDGTSRFYCGTKFLDEKKLQEAGYFKRPSEALAYRARKVKSHIRRLQKIRAQANVDLAEVRKLMAKHGK